jgi:hypothetical protein
MTTETVATQTGLEATSGSPWQRFLALSGVAFAPLFVVGWLSSAVSDSPNYIAAEQKWIKWAHNDHIKGRVNRCAHRHRRHHDGVRLDRECQRTGC